MTAGLAGNGKAAQGLQDWLVSAFDGRGRGDKWEKEIKAKEGFQSSFVGIEEMFRRVQLGITSTDPVEKQIIKMDETKKAVEDTSKAVRDSANTIVNGIYGAVRGIGLKLQ
jgi:hypothetical protein